VGLVARRRLVLVAAAAAAVLTLASLVVVARAWSNACGCGDVASVVLLDGGASLESFGVGAE
jgi:hypothetical protein